MPSTCPICLQHFTSWVDYHEHTSLSHNVKPTHQEIKANAPKPIVKGVYAGPMDKATKARIVRAGERRLGAHHFYGVQS